MAEANEPPLSGEADSGRRVVEQSEVPVRASKRRLALGTLFLIVLAASCTLIVSQFVDDPRAWCVAVAGPVVLLAAARPTLSNLAWALNKIYGIPCRWMARMVELAISDELSASSKNREQTSA